MMTIQEQNWHDFTRHLLIEQEGKGSVQLEIYDEPAGRYGVKAYIYGLWVTPQARKKGLATTLMDQAEEIARRQGCKEVFLDWCELDTPVEIYHWYERRGYDMVAFTPGDKTLLKKRLK